MPAKLRIAIFFAAVVLLAGAVFLIREFSREPGDGQSSAAPIGGKSLSDTVDSGGSSAKMEPPAKAVDPSVPKAANPVAGGMPDPRLPTATPQSSAISGPTSPPAMPNAVNPPATGNVALPPQPPVPASPETLAAVAIDLDKVTLMLRDYRTSMGENPTGTNAEIMKAVMGGNPKGARLGPPENQSLNANGELVDRWGTPIFFHQMSRTSTEIRSAGPDRILWNEDDIIVH